MPVIDEGMMRRVVRETVQETLTGLGFCAEDIHSMQADMLYLRRIRKGSEELGKRVRASLVAVMIPTGLYVAWEILKYKIQPEK